MNVKAKRITTIAMLCALAYVVMAVGRVPVVLFLKYDPKDVVITLGGLIWGPMTACLVSVLVSVLEMFTVSDTGILGCIMNILSTCAFACTASAIYRKKRTLAGAVAGLAAGCAVMVSAMLLWNYLITPLYMGYPREAVAELLLPAFLPFNLLKSGLNSGITFLLYKPVVSSLRKSGLIDAPSGPAARQARRAAASGRRSGGHLRPHSPGQKRTSLRRPMDKANGDAPFIPLYGTAVPGAGLGRLAGLPAAGLRLHRGQAAPEPGVYAAEILLGGRRLCGLAHIAPGGGAPSIELLFFHGGEAPCGEAVELRLRQRLRRCQPFDNLPLLSAQLRLDCLSAQSFWGISPGSPRLPPAVHGARRTTGGGRDAGNPPV